MIQLRSVLNVADNSGAKLIKVILVHGGSHRRFGYVGDIVTAAVEGADTNGTVKDKQVVKAVVVRCRKETRRDYGTYVRYY
jgi:large subunit ribosomal protein L14